MSLPNELLSVLNFSSDPETEQAYRERITKGGLTKEEDPISHFCAYFLPFNPQDKKILFGHHKKSGKWLSPGGHIDKGESLLETLNREINEELGVKDFFKEKPNPFLLTITDIDRDPRQCKRHFDVWYLMKTRGNDFQIDMSEYHEVRWLTISDARKLTRDRANQLALQVIEQTQV